METTLEKFRKAICRQAILMEIGGFRPPQNPMSSWFGKVGFGLPGETWPRMGGFPMHALCQINLTELPFRPPRLEDLEFITIFIRPDELPVDELNGRNWCLRASSAINELVALSPFQTSSTIESFPMRPKIVEEDFPIHHDLPVATPPEIEERYYDLFDNTAGFKLGGWPTLIQSEIYWGSNREHPIRPEYVLQIGSTEKGNWMWGDNGVGYFGRGTTAGSRDDWACEWQCY